MALGVLGFTFFPAVRSGPGGQGGRRGNCQAVAIEGRCAPLLYNPSLKPDMKALPPPQTLTLIRV